MTDAITSNDNTAFADLGLADDSDIQGESPYSQDLPQIAPRFASDEDSPMLTQRPTPAFAKACPLQSSMPPENDSHEASGGNPIPHGVLYRDEICTAAQRHGLDPLLLAAVAAQETGGPGSNSGSNVVGADGTGHGVFQIDSGTWESWLSSHHDGMNVAENADKAATILSDNLKSTGGNIKAALHLYNAGSASRPTTNTTWGDHQTLDYESSVMRHVVALNGKEKHTVL